MRNVPHHPPVVEWVGPDMSRMAEWPDTLGDLNHPFRRAITYIYQDGMGVLTPVASGVNIALRRFLKEGKRAFVCDDGAGSNKTDQVARVAMGVLYHLDAKGGGNEARAVLVAPKELLPDVKDKIHANLVYLDDQGFVQPLPGGDRLELWSYDEFRQRLIEGADREGLKRFGFFGFVDADLVPTNRELVEAVQRDLAHAFRMYASANIFFSIEGAIFSYAEVHEISFEKAAEAVQVRLGKKGECKLTPSKSIEAVRAFRQKSAEEGATIRREHPFWGRIEVFELKMDKAQLVLDRRYSELLRLKPEQRDGLMVAWRKEMVGLQGRVELEATVALVDRELSKAHRPIIYGSEAFLTELEEVLKGNESELLHSVVRLSEQFDKETNLRLLEEFTGATRKEAGRKVKRLATASVILIPDGMSDELEGLNQGNLAAKLKDMRRRTLVVTSFTDVTCLVRQLCRVNRADSVAPAKVVLLMGATAFDVAAAKGVMEGLHVSYQMSGSPIVGQVLEVMPDFLQREEERFEREHQQLKEVQESMGESSLAGLQEWMG